MPFKDGKWIPPEKDWERVRGKEVQPAKPTTYKSPNGADILRTDFTNFGLNDLINASKEVARKSKQFTPTPAPSYTRSPAATPSPVDKVSSNRYAGNLQGVFDLEKALYGDNQTQPTTPNPALKSVIDFETLTNNGNPIHRDPIPVSQVNPEKRAPKTGYDMLKELLGVNETPFDSIAEILKPLGDTNFIKNTNAVANEFSQGVAQSSGLNDLLSWYDKNGVLKDTQNQMHEHNLEDISKGAAGASNFGGQIAGLLPATVGAAATGGRLLEKVGEKIFSKAPKWLKRLGVGATAGAGTGATLATGQELLQSNNDQSLGEHLGDIGQNAAYFAAYGAASPVAGKILDSIGSKLGTTLPAGAKDALSAIGNKAPILPMIGRGVAEGGLTGSMVGGGMALGTLATTGDPNKALDVLTGEAGSEMKENFVEAIAFGIIRQLGGKGVHVNPQAAQEEAANVIMEQFPPTVRAKLELMVEQAKIQGADDAQAKAQVIDIMGSLPDGKDILEKASAQILQDMQALEEAQIEGDVSTKPAATIESNPIEQPSHEKDPEWNRLENEITDAIREDDYKKAEVLQKNQLEVEKKLGFDRPNRPPSKQEEMASKLAEFFGEADGPAQVDNEVMAPQENKNHPKPRNLHAEWSRLEAQIEEADLREDQELVETLQAEQAEIDKLMEAEEDKSKPPATPSKPPETSKVETPTTGKQSVKAVKGDTVKLKGKPNDTYEVVDIDKTKVTLRSKQGTEFVAGAGAIASVVNPPAKKSDPVDKNEPTSITKNVVFKPVIEIPEGLSTEQLTEISEDVNRDIYDFEETLIKRYGEEEFYNLEKNKENGKPIKISERELEHYEKLLDQRQTAGLMRKNLIIEDGKPKYTGLKLVPSKSNVPAKQYKEGDSVSWTNRNGETLTGKVRSDTDTQDTDVSVKIDQSTTAGVVPIGRVAYIPINKLNPAAATEPNIEVKDDQELNIIKTKSLQSGKEELSVSLTDFPEHRVKLIPSEINGTYIARYQDLQKVVNNKDEAIQWAKDRLNETQAEKVSNLETGKKIKLTMYQGRGASLEDIYGKDAVEAGHAVPILGKGDYYAFNSSDAANYGDVTSKEVRLNNPIVIYSGKQFRDLLEKADALHLDSQDEHFYKEPNKIPQATQKLQDYLKGLGHDGAVIQVGHDKRLNESFGHDQVVEFGSNSEQAVQNESNNDTVEANKPTFAKGNKVTWTDRSGKTLTGTIRSIDTRDNYAEIDTDQIVTYGGGVPIGRIEMVSFSALSLVDNGKTVTVKTERGTEVEVKYAIVDAKKLISSNHPMTFKENENYPQQLQPRDRTRASSEEQITRILANLEPEFLGASPKSSEGAPIVGNDLVVESGNGRTMALARGYATAHKSMKKYREWLAENAASFGLSNEDLAKANPILVRVRQTDMTMAERANFSKESNEQSVAAMSATELANADSKRLTGDIMVHFRPGEDGEILTLSNQDFIRSFVGTVISPNERSRYMGKDGQLNQDGVVRIRNAVFAKAYGDTSAIEKLAESTDNNVKNITNAMLSVASNFAIMKEEIEKGNLHPLDITEDISSALNKLSDLRNNGQSVEYYFNQGSMFDDLTNEAKNILAMFDANKRSQKKIAAVLQAYTDVVESAGSPNQLSLFGEDEVPNKLDVLDTAIKKAGEENGNQITLWPVESENSSEVVGSGEKESSKQTNQKVETTHVLNDHHAKMKERADRARQRIKSKYGSGGNTLSSGFPPDLMIDFSIIGYTKILDGLADFKSWSESMMKDADGLVANSERIRKWLPGIYATSKQIAESEDPDILIDEFLVDAYGENPETKNEVPATKGKTIKLFHGSDKTFDKFRSGSAQAGKGIFFTDNAESAKEYGKNIYIVEVEAKKIANDDDWRKTVEEIDEEYTTARRKIEEDFDNDLISESEMDTLLDKSHSEWLIGESADHKQNAMVSDRLKAIGFDIYQGDMQSGDEGKEYLVLDESIIKSVIKGGTNNVTQPLRDNGKGPLEETPSEDVQGSSSNRANTSSSAAGAGKDGRNADKDTSSTDREGSGTGTSAQSAEDRLHDTEAGPSVGDGEGNVHSPSKRSGRSGSRSSSSTVSGKKPGLELNQPRRDFVITTELDNLGGAKSRFKTNVEAIRILSLIEKEGRIATPEEQAQLSKYVGWGGLAQSFDSKNENWDKEYKTLQSLVQDGVITKDEYDTARRSTQYAHYTTKEVVNTMYQIVQRMGFKGGKILEPAMGTGNFFGMMPSDMTGLSSRTGVEMDPLSGRIAKQLYQKANIQIKGFEDYKVSDGYFDMAIGNPPFSGEVKISYNKKRENLHNFFFLQSLDKVRDGGIVAFVTSSGTMNSESGARVRKLIAGKANFLGAVRLPGDAFKKNAGTEVTTDIIFLQKRPKGEQEAHVSAFIETRPFKVGENTFDNNEYFIDHPDRVLGEYVEDKLYQGRIGVKSDGRNLEDSLTALIQKFPSNIYEERSTKAQKDHIFQEVSFDKMHELHDGAYAVSPGGEVIQRVGDQMLTTGLSGLKAKRIANMVPIRDQARTVIRLMLNNVEDSQLKEAQSKLNKLYDEFIDNYGLLTDSANVSVFSPDSLGAGVLMSLEKKNKNGEMVKEAIFHERTISGQSQTSNVETAEEALVVSLFETGRLDFKRMAELSGKKEDQLIEELQGKIFHDPSTRQWVTEDEYLSGNVRVKLHQAEVSPDSKHANNVEALKAVQPDDLMADEIFVKLGAPWVSAQDYHDFISEFLEFDRDLIKVSYNPIISKYTIVQTRGSYVLSQNFKNTDEYGVKSEPLNMDKTAIDIIEDFMNGRATVFTRTYRDGSKESDDIATNAAKRMQAQINDIFKSWVWEDVTRADRLVSKYNWELNNSRLRDYNGELIYGKAEDFVKLPGSTIALRKHQINAVWRVVQGGNTLLAHVVGSGKTYTVISAAMEMKRLGLVNKSAVVVPNHLIAQWRSDFLKAYPNSNVLVISTDDIPPVTTRKSKGMSDKDFVIKQNKQRSERAAALSKIAVGNYDAVLISHQTFGRLPVSSELVQQHIKDQIAEVRYAMEQAAIDDPKGKTVKELEKTLESLEKKLKENLSNDNKDIAIPFEELGIDQIFVDEAHMFKNLKFHTKMRNVSSLPQTNSMRAQDMYLKTQYLSKLRGNKGIVFATGTPISNTVSEMYTIQRYLGMSELKNLGMSHFDAWAATFGNVVTDFEMNAAGQYKQKTRFSEFNNVPELMNLFETFTDIQTASMLDLPKPANLKYETIIVEMSPDQKDYMKELLDRAENMKNVSPEVDNFLKLTGDGRKAALDIRLVRPDITKDFPDSKINAAVNNMVRIYNDPNLAKDKSGAPVKNPAQLVFLDMGTPKKKNETDESQDERKEDDEDAVNISTYADIKLKLISQGIPADEIAFIHEANTDRRKETLFAKVRSGEIRFLLGSTEKMGAGMNVQERLIALHHIDAPWRPSDVEQREGRINRQGNENDSIYIYQYTTKGSFDKLMWDILTRKSFMIEQVMSGETKSRTLEDMEPMVFRFAEVAAATADNPIFIEKQKIDKNVSELEGEKTQFERKRSGLKRDLANFPSSIKEFKRIIASAKDDLARAMSIPKKDQIMIVKGKRYEIEGAKSVSVVQEEVGAVLIDEYNLADKNLNRGEKATLGSFGGFDIVFKKGYGVFLSGKREHDGGINEESPIGTYSRIRHAFENIVENSQTNINYYQDLIKKLEVDIIEVERLLEAKFEKSEELQAAVNRQFEITQELIALNTQHDQAAQETEDESGDDFAFATSPVEGKPTAKKGPNSKKTEPPIDDPAQPIIDMSAIAHLSPKVVREVADMVAKFLGTSIRDGHVRSGAEGIFNSKTGTGAVRNRSYHEWRVVGHELGHTFSYRYGGWKGFKSELERLAAKTYPGKIPKGREAEEGFAEFFFIWTVDPIKAAEVTPITSASFEDFIGSNKDLAEFFIKVRTIIDNDLTGSPYEKAMGAISSEINPDSEVYGGEYRVPWYKRGVFRVLDYTIPAKDLMKNVEDPNKHVDLSHLLAISGDAKAKALLSFESTPRDHEGRFIEGRSLLTISEEAIQIIGKKIKWKVTKLKAINEDMGALEIFSTIMLAKRVKERIGKGFQKLPLTEIEADNVLVQATKDFPEAMKLADEYAINFSNLMLEKLERADIITPETRKIINAGSHSYMAFYYDERKRPVTSGRGESGKTNRNPVKRFTGKSAPVLNFFQATMLKLTEVEQAIEYKRALNTLQDILSGENMGMFGVKIPTPIKVQTLNLEQVMEAVSDLLDESVNMENISDDRAIKIFMAGGFDQISKSEPIVMNIRNGKPTFMRLSPDLFKTLMAMKPVQIEGLAKGLAWSSRVLRYTALSTVRYVTNAIVRDFAGALVQSKAPVHSLLKEFHVSAGATLGLNKDVYNSYVASGGHSGAAENLLKGMVRNTFDEGIISTSAAGWGKVKSGSKTVMVRVIRTPSEALRVIEEGPRIAEYIAVWKNQVKDLGFDAEQMWKVFTKEGTDALPAALQNRMEKIIVESSYASREVATNFGLHGESEWTRKYMQTVTFLHGTTQGMYRFSRQVKDDPKRVMIGVGVLSLVSATAWALMSDDDDDKRYMNDLDSAARDRYWWVPIKGTGMYYAISKPFEYAFPANFLERYLDHAYSNDPDARKPMEDYRVAIVDSFGLHPINPFLNTWMELQSNIAWHGGNIVPLSEQNIAKDMQFGPDTSSTAKVIAKPINMVARLFADSTADPTVGVSPRKIDYFIKQMTGRYGAGILDSIDYVRAKLSGKESKGTAGAEYAPVIGAIFYSQAEGSSRIVEKFYNNYKKTQTLSQSSGKMMNEGLTSIPFFATEENIKMIRYLPAMTSIANELSAIRKDFKGFQEGATPEVRRRITMQQDFIEKLAAGLMYGVPPASPHPDAEITDELIQTISDRLIAKAQQAIINEKKRKGGATEQADYLQQLIDQKNSK